MKIYNSSSNYLKNTFSVALTVILGLPLFSLSQEKIYPIKTNAKPSQLSTYKVDEANGRIDLLFVKKEKKADLYATYAFDKDLNLVEEKEEELEIEQAKKKMINWGSTTSFALGGTMGGIIKDNVLSVENNLTGVMSLKKGYIGWTAIKNPMNGSVIMDQGFIARETVKPTTTDNRKLSLVAFKTDMPGEYFSEGRSLTSKYGKEKNMAGAKSASEATGDVVVVSSLKTFGVIDKSGMEKIPANDFKFLVQRFSAEKLEKTAETSFDLGYINTLLHKQDALDDSGDLLLIMSPNMGIKQFVNPNKNEYTYLRIGKDTKVKEKVSFNSPYGKLHNITIYTIADETYIVSTTEEGNENKYIPMVPLNRMKDTHLMVIKIEAGKQEYLTTTPISTLQSITNGGTAYAGKGFLHNNIVKLADNSIFISGQGYTIQDNANNYGDNYAFLIAADGKIKKHFTMPKLEKNDAAEKIMSPQITKLLNNGSIFWNVYEFTKKGNMYPKYVCISNGAASAITYPGNKQFVSNEVFPIYVYEDKKAVFFFGNTEDTKQLWINKVTF